MQSLHCLSGRSVYALIDTRGHAPTGDGYTHVELSLGTLRLTRPSSIAGSVVSWPGDPDVSPLLPVRQRYVAATAPDRVLEYTCLGNHDGTGPHRWFASLDDVTRAEEAAAGVTDELLEPLSSCISTDDPWLEYGVVEYRFRLRYPELFAAHVRERGHRMFGDRITASAVRFASVLGRLAERGELIKESGPATGAWAPQDVTFWAVPPGSGDRLTWAQWCKEHGRSPEWTEEDRFGLGR